MQSCFTSIVKQKVCVCGEDPWNSREGWEKLVSSESSTNNDACSQGGKTAWECHLNKGNSAKRLIYGLLAFTRTQKLTWVQRGGEEHCNSTFPVAMELAYKP
jgi:hypothetical protein